MKISNQQLMIDVVKKVDGVNHVLSYTKTADDLNPNDCSDMAYKLEQAMSALLTLAARLRQENINSGVM